MRATRSDVWGRTNGSTRATIRDGPRGVGTAVLWPRYVLPHLPLRHVPASTNHFTPLSKMSRDGIEVHIEAITGEKGQATRNQELSQGVDEYMRRILRAGAEIKHRQKLGAGVDGQPEPEHLGTVAEPCAQFIQLHMRELEVAEKVLVQRLSVLASAGQPGGDGRLLVAEDSFSGGSIQSFGKGS